MRFRFTESENAALVSAIGAAERGTAGELRLVILSHLKGDPIEEAKRQFTLLGLEKTAARSAVVFLVCPKARKAAIIGDIGIHEKVGDDFWRAVVTRSAGYFAAGDMLLGILSAVDEIGSAFRTHLPAGDAAGNELPDDVVYE